MLSVARNEKLGNNIHNKGKHFNGQISTDLFIQHQQKPEKTVTEQNFKTIVTVYALLHVIVFNDEMSELRQKCIQAMTTNSQLTKCEHYPVAFTTAQFLHTRNKKLQFLLSKEKST